MVEARAAKKSVAELFGMPAVPTTGRERLLTAAGELVAREGVGAGGGGRGIGGGGGGEGAVYKHARGQGGRDGGGGAAGAETFADCFTALIEGALILRQIHGRNDAARVVRAGVEQLVRAYLPGASR